MEEKQIKKEINETNKFWNADRKSSLKFSLKIKELLDEHGEFKFDWEEGNAPSVVSTHFDDDITDCYVTRIGFDEENRVVCDLYAYYIGDECHNVSIDDICNTAADFAGILSEMLNALLYENEK